MTLGPLYLISAAYLGVVVAFTFSLIEGDTIKEVGKATLRRTMQLYGLLIGLGLIVWILDLI